MLCIFCSDSVAKESKTPTVTSGGEISSSHSVTGHQTAWFGASGQLSMADIVKMGRPHNKTSNSQKNVDMRSEVNPEHENAANQHVPVKDEWPSIEKPVAATTSSVSVAPTESEICNSPADLQSSRRDQHPKGQLEDTHLKENGPFGNLGRDHVQPDTVAGGAVQEDDSGVSSEYDDNPYRYQTQKNPVEHPKGKNLSLQLDHIRCRGLVKVLDYIFCLLLMLSYLLGQYSFADEDEVLSVAANLQDFSIESHDQYSSHVDGRPAVVIPDHLQIHTEDCSQLSFGSFGGFGSRPLSNSLEEASDVAPQIEHTDSRYALIADFPFPNSFWARFLYTHH